ncbi:MAG TPA: DUF4097 family beta strand repeat-containing protein [Steroidobacteraceae bacterium]|nr:DUF4097 family beta strand repeat-containing protein [Steroidobacteraceae bacterium]
MRNAYHLSAALLMLIASAAVSASDRDYDRTVAAQPHGVVDISNVAGRVEVRGWDRAEVSVHGELEEGVERVDVSSEGGRTIIKVVLPHNSGRHGEAQLKVQIPKGSELDVSAVSADVATSGVQGMQRLSAVSGDVSAELYGGDLELKTVSGDVHLKGHGQPAKLHVSTVSGDMHLEHGAGDLEAGTVSGTLVATLDTARSVRVRSTSGDLRFDGRLAHGASFDASTVSGDLNVRASADGGFAFEVSSFSGDITNCFGVKAERTSQYGPGSVLQGTRGEGAGHVRLKTMSGDVQLCDRT